MKQLFKKYNHQNNLLMISLFPKKGEVYSAGTSGVASYAKNIVTNLTNHQSILLCDYKNKKEIYEEGNVLVNRCFKRNSPFLWVHILKEMSELTNIKKVVVQLDFAMYGGILTTISVLPFLAILKIFKYKTNIVMHHVVTSAMSIKGHLGLGEGFRGKCKGILYNVAFHLFYFFLGIFSDKIIVLEEILKERLSRVVSNSKLVTIPHGVDTNLNPVPKPTARKLLGLDKKEYVVVFFGFINWFKGSDFFVDSYADIHKILGKKIKFIMAGGKSPTMMDKPFYQKYFGEVLEKIYNSHNISITGYIPQKRINIYFSAADLIVLPYRNFMTASGVCSLVFSYKRPFIVSDKLGEMFDAEDFKGAFTSSGLKKDDLIFELDKYHFRQTTVKVLRNGIKNKMKNMAQIIRERRSYKNTALLYEELIFGAEFNKNSDIIMNFAKEYD